MANAIHKWRDRDLKRMLKVAKSSGFEPTSIEVDIHSGKIRVSNGGKDAPETETENPWAKVIPSGASQA